MFKTILIDDEKLAIKRLERLLGKHNDVFEIIGEASNGAEGLALVDQLQPDLIFLDIEMPGMNGFEMLARLSYMPRVVFATAFEEYAIRAFEENSIDYLLKPIEESRLKLTIEKLHKTVAAPSATDYNKQLMSMLEQFKPRKEMVSVPVRVGDRIFLIRMEEIVRFEAEDKYVYLYLADDKRYLTDYTLSALSEKLPADFVRVSKSVIVNRRYIHEVQKYFNGRYVLCLSDKARTQVTSGSAFSEKVKQLIEF
jgi:two-component system, LytTR family, response regulator